MKALLVSSLRRGGPLEQALVLAGGLARAGVSVHALCADDAAAARFSATGADADVLPQRHGPDLAAAARLWRRMTGFDVVHAQDRRSGLWTRLAPGIISAARVYTVHGLPNAYMPPPLGRELPSWRDRIAYEGLDAGLCRFADAIVIPSQTLARQFIDRLGFPAKRVHVVPNGVELPSEMLRPGREVGTLSLLEPVKNLPTFLNAAALLSPIRPQLRFVVFGEGSQKALLHEQAVRLGIAQRVEFPGHVPKEAALCRLAVMVLPSIMETAPMALLEAMAAGVPVVAARRGGIPEIAGEDTAVLVDPDDPAEIAEAVRVLLDDPELARERALAGRERIRTRFTLAANVTATTAVYEQAIAVRRRR